MRMRREEEEQEEKQEEADIDSKVFFLYADNKYWDIPVLIEMHQDSS